MDHSGTWHIKYSYANYNHEEDLLHTCASSVLLAVIRPLSGFSCKIFFALSGKPKTSSSFSFLEKFVLNYL